MLPTMFLYAALRPSPNCLDSFTCSSACCRSQFSSSKASFVPHLVVTVLGSSPASFWVGRPSLALETVRRGEWTEVVVPWSCCAPPPCWNIWCCSWHFWCLSWSWWATHSLPSKRGTGVPWVSCRDPPAWRLTQGDETSERQLVRSVLSRVVESSGTVDESYARVWRVTISYFALAIALMLDLLILANWSSLCAWMPELAWYANWATSVGCSPRNSSWPPPGQTARSCLCARTSSLIFRRSISTFMTRFLAYTTGCSLPTGFSCCFAFGNDAPDYTSILNSVLVRFKQEPLVSHRLPACNPTHCGIRLLRVNLSLWHHQDVYHPVVVHLLHLSDDLRNFVCRNLSLHDRGPVENPVDELPLRNPHRRPHSLYHWNLALHRLQNLDDLIAMTSTCGTRTVFWIFWIMRTSCSLITLSMNGTWCTSTVFSIVWSIGAFLCIATGSSLWNARQRSCQWTAPVEPQQSSFASSILSRSLLPVV